MAAVISTGLKPVLTPPDHRFIHGHSFLAELRDVRDKHDPVENCDSEEHNESHGGGDGKVETAKYRVQTRRR